MKSLSVLAYPMEGKFGGPPRAVASIYPGLSENFESSLILFGHADKDLIEEAEFTTAVFRQKTITRGISRVFVKWNKDVLFNLKSADVILVHGYYFPYYLKLAFTRKGARSIFVMPHGVFEIFQQRKSTIRKFIFDLLVDLSGINRRVTFIVATESEVIGVRKKFPNSIVKVVGLAVDVPEDLKLDKAIQKRESWTIVHFGRIAEKKRIDLTIRSLRKLRDAGLEVDYLIIGDGKESLKTSLLTLARELELVEHIRFSGHLDSKERFLELRRGDILVLPSENENFAISVAEAIALGIPSVLSNQVALHSIVEDHQLGKVIYSLSEAELTNSILELIEDYETYANRVFQFENPYEKKLIQSRWVEILSK